MLIDEVERARALSSLDENLVVEAAAGTGKTALLVGRICKLLANGRTPKSIIAITFTEPSASELAVRVARMVESLTHGEVPEELRLAFPLGVSTHERSHLLNSVARLDELTTSTIHGYCQEIIRSFAIDAGLDPGSAVIDAQGADALFGSALSDWLMERLSVGHAADDPVVVLARQVPLDVVDLLRKLADMKRSHPMARAADPQFELRPDLVFTRAVADFEQWFAKTPGEPTTTDLLRQLRELESFYADCFESHPSFDRLWNLAHPPRLQIMTWNEYQLARYEKKSAWDRSCGAEAGPGYFDRASEYFLAADLAYQQLLGTVGAGLVHALSSSLDELLLLYQKRKRAAAVLDFDDLLLHARNLVCQYPQVRESLHEQHRHLLVDEFQDTDPIQAEIIFLIASENESASWLEAPLRAGSLFLVGDPKQAIYRFRGADIATYDRAISSLRRQSPDCVLRITTNFRSRPAILTHVNTCFTPILNGPGQPGYVNLSPSIAASDDSWSGVARLRVDVEASDPRKRPSADDQREEEASRVAQLCTQLIGSSVSSKDGDDRRLFAGDIVLLSPAHTDLWRYERALENAGISVASQAGKTLMKRQETQDILCLLRSLSDPFDTLALGALLRGPLVGLTEEELLDLHHAVQSVAGLDTRNGLMITTPLEQIGHPVARQVLGHLQYLRRRALETTPKLLLSEAIERLQLRVVLAARHGTRGARALANLEMLIEMAGAYAVGGLRAFVASLQEDWEKKTAHAEGRIDEARDAVQIVTVHSAKGQEWPIVIPINMGTRFRFTPQFVYLPSDNSLHWMIGGVASPTLFQARELEAGAERLQRERLWYVACTRARDLLVIPDLPAAGADTWIRAVDLQQGNLREWSADAWTGGEESASVADAANEQTMQQFLIEDAAVKSSSPSIHWQIPSEHDADQPTEAVVISAHVDGAFEIIEIVGPGSIRGLILHKLFEEVLNAELEENQASCDARAQVLLRQLTGSEEESQLPNPAEIARTCLRALAHPELSGIRHLLQPEYPVWREDGDHYLSGRIDAMAADENGVTSVIDWKSDVAPSVNTKLAYRSQLGAYLRATGAARGAIVYASLGEIEWVALPHEAR
jgi:ATP-dependent exoDNAse (exonuclease V) beta subunit